MSTTARRLRILAVTQPSVADTMGAAAQQLDAAGHDLRSVAAAAFNAARTPEPGVDILLVSNAARCDRAALSRFPDLVAVVFIASGTESVDVAAATERGIVVAHGHAEENADSMAEATVLLMLAVLYDLNRAQLLLQTDAPPPPKFARMLQGRVVGLVGWGKIARGVATRLQGWGVTLLVATRTPAAIEGRAEIVELDALMTRSDVVSLHAALNAQTRGMIGRAELSRLRPGSVLINTARGGLVDEAALAELAVERQLWLGLDTFEQEPLPSASPLRGLPRTILTPHRVGHTVEANASLVRIAAENVELIARGAAPLHARNWTDLQASLKQ